MFFLRHLDLNAHLKERSTIDETLKLVEGKDSFLLYLKGYGHFEVSEIEGFSSLNMTRKSGNHNVITICRCNTLKHSIALDSRRAFTGFLLPQTTTTSHNQVFNAATSFSMFIAHK